MKNQIPLGRRLNRRAGANEGAQQGRGQCCGALVLVLALQELLCPGPGVEYLKGSSPLTNTTNISAGSISRERSLEAALEDLSGPF